MTDTVVHMSKKPPPPPLPREGDGRRPQAADATIPTTADRREAWRRRGGGTSHGISHETTAMAIKGAITSPSEQTRFRLLHVRPAVAMAPEWRLRASSSDSRLGFRTHTHITGRRWSYFSTVSHFCLLGFREGEKRGDVQTQHTATFAKKQKKKR